MPSSLSPAGVPRGTSGGQSGELSNNTSGWRQRNLRRFGRGKEEQYTSEVGCKDKEV